MQPIGYTMSDALHHLEDVALAIGLATESVVDGRPVLREHCERRLDRLSGLPPRVVEAELEETARASGEFRVYEPPAPPAPVGPSETELVIRLRRAGRARRR